MMLGTTNIKKIKMFQFVLVTPSSSFSVHLYWRHSFSY